MVNQLHTIISISGSLHAIYLLCLFCLQSMVSDSNLWPRPRSRPWTCGLDIMASFNILVCTLKEYGLSYQHQSWYRCSPWQPLAMLKQRSQTIKSDGQMVTKKATVKWLLLLPTWVSMSTGLHIFLLYITSCKKYNTPSSPSLETE